ncbi:MAG: ABC transporter permease [Bacteroidaceae bacterium]|nr:ABC transporter permease [Bacteroidaceae bacterium]
MIRWSRCPLSLRIAWRELRAISRSYSVLLVLVGGIFFYGLLYNYMYAPNVVHQVPVAVVDHAQTALSRQYIRWLDATPQVHVAYREPDMVAAKQRMRDAQVWGILYLPSQFETLLYEGRQAVYPLYVSTDAFLYYEAIEEANLRVMEAIDDAYRTQLTEFLSLPALAAVATQSPVTVVGTALYNPVEGYGIYLIPSVLMIIIFQTLMMLVAMTSNRKSETALPALYRGRARSLVCGKCLAHLLLYGVFALFLVGALPLVFDIPRVASWWSLPLLLVPYVVSTSCLGLALSRWYTDPEAPILLIAFFSIGLIFLSGVSYPLELMPWYWQAAHYVVPAGTAVLAFVKLSAMQASLVDVVPELITLCAQVVVYFVLAVRVYKIKLREAR